MVDIFEAGPVVRCALSDIRAVRESRTATVINGAAPMGSETYLISNGREPFRAGKGPVDISNEGQAILPAELAAALNVQAGDMIRYVPLKTNKAQRYHDANISFD
jgi:arginine N-succinyltransferase